MKTLGIKIIGTVVVLAQLSACGPHIKTINGNKNGTPKFYLVDGKLNTIQTRRGWEIDSISNGTIVSVKSNTINVTLDSSIRQRNLMVSLSTGRSGRTEKIEVAHGDAAQPLIRHYPSSRGLSFDDLRFFRLMASNIPSSPEIIDFKIKGMRITFEGYAIVAMDGSIPKQAMKTIFNSKPGQIVLDSITMIGSDGNTYHSQEVTTLNLSYPLENRYSCLDLDSKSVYDFKDVTKGNSSDQIRLNVNSENCEIIHFENLGTQSEVVITDSNGKILYKESIRAGEMGIKNFFLFEGLSEFDVQINGDYTWKGRVIIDRS